MSSSVFQDYFGRGLVANRPTPASLSIAPGVGAQYWATDESILYELNLAGTAWQSVSGGGGGGATSGGDTTTGWRKTSDGFIEQWGILGGSQPTADNPVTFSIPFTEGVSAITALTYQHSGATNLGYTFAASNVTLTGFTPRPRYQQNGVTDKPGEVFHWRAFGK